MTRKLFPRLLVSSALLSAGLVGVGLPAASAQVQNRIISQATNSYTAIPGSVHPRARSGSDLGPAAAGTKLDMSIRFNMTDTQQASLNQLLNDLQNPSSPRYHQWLTPAQYAAQFGMSSGDIAKVSAWLAASGFKVTGVANSGTFITFTGTAAQAQTAFSTSIHNVSVNGETHFANVSNISVPSAFASSVSAVTGLHNFRLQPRARTKVSTPKLTSSVSGTHYVTPGDVYTIYNMNPLLNNSINGTGVTIAVTGQVDIYPADVAAFRSAAGLNTANLPTTVYAGTDPGYPACNSCTTSANEGDLAESSLDVEWVGAMAPSASIEFVTGLDALNESMTYAIDNKVAPIITTSYGLCEAGWGTTELNQLNALFEQASAQGQTIIAAAGDAGAADCDAGPSATNGLSVDFPGSSPYVTSMGGTQFNGDAAATGSGTTWAATQYWAGTSGADVVSSALSYIPEVAWNDYNDFPSGFTAGFGGGGGGASGFFSKPAWQQGTGVPADAARDVPDLALNGSDEHDSFLYCFTDSYVTPAADCTNGFRDANGNFDPAGGTSFDSQIFGGMLALVEQKIGSHGVGNANLTLYALANHTAYYTPGQTIATLPSVVFNDVTSGNNDMPCTTGTPNCATGGSIGYVAGSGYDEASGWGSVNLSNLANAWNVVTPFTNGTNGTFVSATSLTTSSSSVVAGTAVTLTATVTGSNGTPTGTVQFLVNGAVAGSGTLNGSGVATYSYTTSCANLALLALPKLTPSRNGVDYAGSRSGGPVQQGSSKQGLWYGAGSGASIACLLLLTVPRRRRLGGLLVVLFAIALVSGISGCGSSQAGPPSSGSGGSTSTGPTSGTLILGASYSGNSTYAGSIASGIPAGGVTTAVTPIEVTVTVGTCTAI